MGALVSLFVLTNGVLLRAPMWSPSGLSFSNRAKLLGLGFHPASIVK